MYENLNDNELIALIKQDNLDAFDVLIERYQDELFNYLAYYMSNREVAYDIAQDAFLKLFRYRKKFDEKHGNFKGLLFTTAINLAKNYFRKNKNRKTVSIDNELQLDKGDTLKWELPDESQDTEDKVSRKETISNIEAALENLPEKFKEIILLRDYEGYSYEEIADMLGISMGTVKSRINRGRSKIIQLVGEAEKN